MPYAFRPFAPPPTHTHTLVARPAPRPHTKNLIHVTCGRLIWPSLVGELTDDERGRIDVVVQRWVGALSDGRLPSGEKLRSALAPPAVESEGAVQGGGEVVIHELELVRDTQWMMKQRQRIEVYRV